MYYYFIRSYTIAKIITKAMFKKHFLDKNKKKIILAKKKNLAKKTGGTPFPASPDHYTPDP